jgi:hypothetical protein
MLVKLLVALAFVVLVVRLLRFALSLRAQMQAREQERAAQTARGRRVVAELPLDDGVFLFLEDAAGFYWREGEVARRELAGARLLLNGGVVAQASRPGVFLPGPGASAELEGSEQWEVALHLARGEVRRVPCGRLREGVSREAATAVFEAVRAALEA